MICLETGVTMTAAGYVAWSARSTLTNPMKGANFGLNSDSAMVSNRKIKRWVNYPAKRDRGWLA